MGERMTVVEQINGFRKLAKNWDSYSGEPTRLHAVAAALALVKRARKLGWPEPEASPHPDGSISLEWEGLNSGVDMDAESGLALIRAAEAAARREAEEERERLRDVLSSGLVLIGHEEHWVLQNDTGTMVAEGDWASLDAAIEAQWRILDAGGLATRDNVESDDG